MGKVFFAAFYGEPEGVVKIIASSEQEAMEKIFKTYPEHEETEGEDIEYVLSEEKFIADGHKWEGGEVIE